MYRLRVVNLGTWGWFFPPKSKTTHGEVKVQKRRALPPSYSHDPLGHVFLGGCLEHAVNG